MSRRAAHPIADHVAAAAGLREMPGVELLVATYRGRSVAEGTAHQVRRAGVPAYTPAGSFEARIAPVGDETGLYVRFIGANAEVSA